MRSTLRFQPLPQGPFGLTRHLARMKMIENQPAGHAEASQIPSSHTTKHTVRFRGGSTGTTLGSGWQNSGKPKAPQTVWGKAKLGAGERQ